MKLLLIHEIHLRWTIDIKINQTIAFRWFKKLINSKHNHNIRILVTDYISPVQLRGWGNMNFDKPFFEFMVNFIEKYHDTYKVSKSGAEVFFGDDVLKYFSPTLQDEMKGKLKQKGITLVDTDAFFIDAINEGFDIHFINELPPVR